MFEVESSDLSNNKKRRSGHFTYRRMYTYAWSGWPEVSKHKSQVIVESQLRMSAEFYCLWNVIILTLHFKQCTLKPQIYVIIFFSRMHPPLLLKMMLDAQPPSISTLFYSGLQSI